MTECLNTTREDKPYCSGHVGRFPYVQEILAQLANREHELLAVRQQGWRAVDIDGPVVKDILERLRKHGPRTIERLRRDCLDGDGCLDGAAQVVIAAYKNALARAGLITLGRTRRGSTTLRAVP